MFLSGTPDPHFAVFQPHHITFPLMSRRLQEWLCQAMAGGEGEAGGAGLGMGSTAAADKQTVLLCECHSSSKKY